MGLIGWIFSHKLLLIFLAATVAFGVSTITLAVQKSDLQEELDTYKQENTDPPVTETTTESSTDTTQTPTKPTPTETSTEPTTTEPPEDMSNYRLPITIIPVTYDLYLYPDLTTELFDGKVEARIEVFEDHTELKIHSNGLKIKKAEIEGKEANVELLEKYELLVLTLPGGEVIKHGKRTVTIEYSGDMANRIVGFYSSHYTGSDGNQRTIATSKFEPTYARQAFPCFDEPAMKAKYTVHIQRPSAGNYIALSNMPEKAVKSTDDDHVLVTFEESVKMSTYLSCFIVCDFDYKEVTVVPTLGEQFLLRVYATPAQKEKTAFALEVAEAVITYFVQYFDIAYPLPKLDLIAIPDFVSGAMEHWGLVTFRETALLFDETTSSTVNKQRVASVVSHELAHSWFGNLVTMEWWNDLWLNEGFASYIQYKGIDSKYKDWQMLDQFLIETLHSVLSLDATLASHPIVQTVVTPDQITEIFDSITYSKGASILRMLETAVTENVFRAGVTDYLKEHAMGNAVTQDLLDKLQEKVPEDLNVTEFMNTWTVQKGYPILTVREEGDKYILTQKRFLKNYDNAEDVPSSYNYRWTIPITYFVSDKQPAEDRLVWFKYNEEKLEIPKPTGANWVKFNRDQVGYYRVNYPKELWKVLSDNIKAMSISDKTHLLEESFSIAESGDLAYEVPLDLTKYLGEEFNYVPWSVASTKLEMIRKYLTDSQEYSNYIKYIISILTPAYDQLKWDAAADEGHLQRRARTTILGLACSVGHANCLEEASTRFKNWLQDSQANPIAQDLHAIVYHYGMVNNGNKEWEQLFDLYKKEIDANEKLNMLKGLASVKEPWLLKRLIEIGKIVGDDQVIRGQDYFTMLQYISANPVGTAIVWDYVRENWQYLVDRFTLNDRYLGRLIPAITSSFITKTKLNEMSTFFAEHQEAGAGQAAREEALTNVKNNIKWTEQNREDVEKWIKATTNPDARTK